MSVFVATTAVGWGHGSVFACPGGVVTDCFSCLLFLVLQSLPMLCLPDSAPDLQEEVVVIELLTLPQRSCEHTVGMELR